VSVGDIGWVDADGYLFLADRRTDLIITGGANVYPAEVEAALTEHPSVGDVAVIGLPDDDWGKRVHAVVQLAVGSEPAAADLECHCRERLASYKVPKTWEFVEQLPRDDAGKLRRSALVAERTGNG
jgi:bile acid-coenzyme A ligase